MFLDRNPHRPQEEIIPTGLPPLPSQQKRDALFPSQESFLSGKPQAQAPRHGLLQPQRDVSQQPQIYKAPNCPSLQTDHGMLQIKQLPTAGLVL